MPHVVIRGELDLAAFARDFKGLLLRESGDVLRADTVYLERGQRSALVAALVVEAGRKLPFYITISCHDRGTTTIRIDPLTHVERSQGVRRLVAELAATLLERMPGATISVTNLVVPSRSRSDRRPQGTAQESEGSDEDRE